MKAIANEAIESSRQRKRQLERQRHGVELSSDSASSSLAISRPTDSAQDTNQVPERVLELSDINELTMNQMNYEEDGDVHGEGADHSDKPPDYFCPVCQFRNPYDARACRKCQEKRVWLGWAGCKGGGCKGFEQRESIWNCRCSQPNKYSQAYCVSCKKPKPAGVDKNDTVIGDDGIDASSTEETSTGGVASSPDMKSSSSGPASTGVITANGFLFGAESSGVVSSCPASAEQVASSPDTKSLASGPATAAEITSNGFVFGAVSSSPAGTGFAFDAAFKSFGAASSGSSSTGLSTSSGFAFSAGTDTGTKSAAIDGASNGTQRNPLSAVFPDGNVPDGNLLGIKTNDITPTTALASGVKGRMKTTGLQLDSTAGVVGTGVVGAESLSLKPVSENQLLKVTDVDDELNALKARSIQGRERKLHHAQKLAASRRRERTHSNEGFCRILQTTKAAEAWYHQREETTQQDSLMDRDEHETEGYLRRIHRYRELKVQTSCPEKKEEISALIKAETKALDNMVLEKEQQVRARSITAIGA